MSSMESPNQIFSNRCCNARDFLLITETFIVRGMNRLFKVIRARACAAYFVINRPDFAETSQSYYSCLACYMKVAQKYAEHARLGNI